MKAGVIVVHRGYLTFSTFAHRSSAQPQVVSSPASSVGKAAFSLAHVKKLTYEKQRREVNIHYFGENGMVETIRNVDECVYDDMLNAITP